jgi:hypothetical protein
MVIPMQGLLTWCSIGLTIATDPRTMSGSKTDSYCSRVRRDYTDFCSAPVSFEKLYGVVIAADGSSRWAY